MSSSTRSAAISETALTRDVAIAIAESGLPDTFVPGRNLRVLSPSPARSPIGAASSISSAACARPIIPAIPDCRDDTIKAMQLALKLGMDRRFVIHTPLMWIDKAATFDLAHELGGRGFVDLLVEETHTCYLGDRSRRHDWGYGCGECPACKLRADGFARWKAARRSDRESETQPPAGGRRVSRPVRADHSGRKLADRPCRHRTAFRTDLVSMPVAPGLMAPSGVT